MEIRIELDIEKVEPNYLVISDKGFDSPDTWLKISLIKNGQEEYIGDVRLNELMPPLIAFDAKQSRNNPGKD